MTKVQALIGSLEEKIIESVSDVDEAIKKCTEYLFDIRFAYIPLIGPDLPLAQRMDKAVRRLLENPNNVTEEVNSQLHALLLKDKKQPLSQLSKAYCTAAQIWRNKTSAPEVRNVLLDFLGRGMNYFGTNCDKFNREYCVFFREYLQKCREYAQSELKQADPELQRLLIQFKNALIQEDYFDDFSENRSKFLTGIDVDPVKQCTAILSWLAICVIIWKHCKGKL